MTTAPPEEVTGQPAAVPRRRRPRFVVHLPVTADDLATAQQVARVMVRSLEFLNQLDAGESTVSGEDEQGVRRRVFCDRLLDGGRRCILRAQHGDACLPRRRR